MVPLNSALHHEALFECPFAIDYVIQRKWEAVDSREINGGVDILLRS